MASTNSAKIGAAHTALKNRLGFHWPYISVTTVWVLLPILAIVAMCLGWFAASLNEIWLKGALIGIGVVVVATVLVIGVLLVHSNANAVAPLFVTRYGVNELVRAQQLVLDLIMASQVANFRVSAGKLEFVPPQESDSTIDSGTKKDAKVELFRVTSQGNTTLLIDLESAVLIERDGDYFVRHWPKCELVKNDRYINCLPLRPQREPFSIERALTHDTVALGLKGTVIFQIQQNKQHLEQTQSHLGDTKAVQRALMPRDEWKQKTMALVTSAVHAVIREYELWQIFAAPPKPPTPAEMATIYTLGQGILPHQMQGDLEVRIKAKLNESVWRWGVEVTRVILEEVNPPEEIRDAAYRAYLSWNKMSEQILEAEKAAQSKLRTAQIEHEESRLRRESELLDAETAKKKAILESEAEAIAYRTKKHAHAESALEFARKIEIIEQGLGHRMDASAMKELLRALGLLISEKSDDESKWLMDLMARRGYPAREE